MRRNHGYAPAGASGAGAGTRFRADASRATADAAANAAAFTVAHKTRTEKLALLGELLHDMSRTHGAGSVLDHCADVLGLTRPSGAAAAAAAAPPPPRPAHSRTQSSGSASGREQHPPRSPVQHAAPTPGDAAGDQQFVVTLVDADFGTTKRVRVRGHYTVGKVKSLACTTFGVSRPDQRLALDREHLADGGLRDLTKLQEAGVEPGATLYISRKPLVVQLCGEQHDLPVELSWTVPKLSSVLMHRFGARFGEAAEADAARIVLRLFEGDNPEDAAQAQQYEVDEWPQLDPDSRSLATAGVAYGAVVAMDYRFRLTIQNVTRGNAKSTLDVMGTLPLWELKQQLQLRDIAVKPEYQLLCTDRGQVDHAEEVMVMKADVGHGGVLYVYETVKVIDVLSDRVAPVQVPLSAMTVPLAQVREYLNTTEITNKHNGRREPLRRPGHVLLLGRQSSVLTSQLDEDSSVDAGTTICMFQQLDNLNAALTREVDSAIPSATRQIGDIVHRLRRARPSELPLHTLCDVVDQHLQQAREVVLEHMQFLALKAMRFGERQGVGAVEMFQVGVMNDVDGACDAFEKPLYEAEKRVKDEYGKFVEGKDGARRRRLEASRKLISDMLSTERGLCSLARAVQVVSEARSRPRRF